MFMKSSSRLLSALCLLALTSFVQAGDFVSQVVQASTPLASFDIQVPGGHILVIRNFTQEGTFSAITVRGQITAKDKTGATATVITATIADTDPSAVLE